MHNTKALLDKALRLCSPPTDYELAKRLSTSRQRVSNWRRGLSAPDNEAAFRLAKLLGMQTLDVIAYFEEDRATAASDKQKMEFWRHQLPRILPAIAIGTGLLLALGGTLIAGHHGVSFGGALSIFPASLPIADAHAHGTSSAPRRVAKKCLTSGRNRGDYLDQNCQFTLTKAVPDVGTVNAWLAPFSHVTAPLAAMRMNLNWMVAPAGTDALMNQLGLFGSSIGPTAVSKVVPKLPSSTVLPVRKMLSPTWVLIALLTVNVTGISFAARTVN